MKANIKRIQRRTPRKADIVHAWWRANKLMIFAAASCIWELAVVTLGIIRGIRTGTIGGETLLVFMPLIVYAFADGWEVMMGKGGDDE